MAFLDRAGVVTLVAKLKEYFATKDDLPPRYTSNPTMDGTASAGTSAAYASGDHRHPHDTTKQDALVSGTNIKTINGESLLGSGDITVGGGGGGSASGLLVTITSNGNTHTADKTAQEIYDAVTAGIQPVIKYSDYYYPLQEIYTNGSRLTLLCPSAVGGAVLVANSMSDYPSYSGGGGGGDN